jgi:hypothetical protein
MKIQKRRKNLLLTIAGIGLLAVSGISAYAITSHNDADKPPSEVTTELQTKDEATGTKENPAPTTELPQKIQTPPEATPGDATSDSDTVSRPSVETPLIERASQSGDSLKVVASLQKASSGSCQLNIQRHDTASITRTTSIVTGPSYYTCSFAVPVSDIPADGDWNVTILHNVDNNVASSDTKLVTISK